MGTFAHHVRVITADFGCYLHEKGLARQLRINAKILNKHGRKVPFKNYLSADTTQTSDAVGRSSEEQASRLSQCVYLQCFATALGRCSLCFNLIQLLCHYSIRISQRLHVLLQICEALDFSGS